jgi:hypothetical protein
MIPTTKKQILVLANSSKSPGRCVAGIEILSETPEGICFGEFIRPIDATQPEGALRLSKTIIDGDAVRPLDIVEMEFRKHAEDPNHPEDWIIYQGSHWLKRGRLCADRLKEVPHGTEDIWGQRKGIEPGTAEATVQVIKTATPLTVKCSLNNSYGYSRIDKRLHFNGLDISITDTEYIEAHDLDRLHEGSIRDVGIPRESYLVMSLTPPFEPYGCGTKYQYRVVAAIIEKHA